MTPEVRATNALTKAVEGLTRELMHHRPKSTVVEYRGTSSDVTENPVPEPATDESVIKLPAYLPSESEPTIPYDERVAHGYAKIHADHIEINIPRYNYTELTRDILANGIIVGVTLRLDHLKPIHANDETV